MAYLNTCTELDDLGKGSFRSVVHLKPVAYLENGVYRLTSRNVAAYADGTYTHAVLAANIGVRIGDDGRYAVHPTRELARYVAFGGPQVKVGGKWTAIPFDKPTRKDNAVIWTRKQADLKLTHIGHGLKHEMALKNGYVPEDNLIAVAVNLVGLTRSGSTLLADGVPVARIQAPVVYDADNRLDTRPIKWGITSRDGQPYIVYTLPELTGMAAPVVDPTVTLQPDATEGKDTYMYSARPDTVNGGVAPLLIGHNTAESSVARGLIAFDLSTVPDTFDTATLSMMAYQDNSSNARTYRVFRTKRAWVEAQATWNVYSTGNSWSTAGGFHADDCEQTDIGTRDFTNSETTGEFKDFSLTPTTKAALDLGNGWMIKADTENADGYNFYSSDWGTAAQRPKLVIDYTVPSSSGGMLLLGVG